MSARKLPKKSATKPTKPAAAPASPMSVELLQELVKLMSSNDLNTVDLRDGSRRIVLKRGAAVAAGAPVVYAAPHSAPAAAHAAPSAGASSPSAPAAPVAESTEGLIPIKSPMVGTFYAKPAPDAKNFVNVGSPVHEETDVCIIEAMKVFNNIKAETKGTIAKILAEDGKPVEFGQVLFLVKP